MINIPKGTKDVLPSDSYQWQYVEDKAREIARLFNLKEIRTPVFEHTELFLRGVGETTDIVGKEMYTFLDKGSRSITLKPEGTAGAVRSFIENGLFNSPMPLKTFYFTPVFRYEQPQGGRLREHHQFGIEIFGSEKPSVDAELIFAADSFFKSLGVQGLYVNLNSIGCKECRPVYNKALKDFYSENLHNLCPLCRERLDKNPLRILDCKEEGCSKLNESAPKTLDYLCGGCKEHFQSLQDILKAYNLDFRINPRIVRGLDYYTKTVFEFVSENLGAKSTVCGGGRYDNLVELLGGKPTPAAGFGLGLERLLLMLQNMGLPVGTPPEVTVYIAPLGDTVLKALEMVKNLRAEGISAETDLTGRSLKSQMKFADKLPAKFVAVLGEDEVNNNTITVKNMKNGSENKISISELITTIKREATNKGVN